MKPVRRPVALFFVLLAGLFGFAFWLKNQWSHDFRDAVRREHHGALNETLDDKLSTLASLTDVYVNQVSFLCLCVSGAAVVAAVSLLRLRDPR